MTPHRRVLVARAPPNCRLFQNIRRCEFGIVLSELTGS
jgi:hypothetical protein